MNKKYLFLGACAVAAVGAIAFLRSEPTQGIPPATGLASQAADTAMVAITMPDISGNAAVGQNTF